MTPQIFRKLYVAGIIQLLEDWPHMVTRRRANITKKAHPHIDDRPTDGVVKRVSLNGNIQAILCIFIAFIAIASVEILVVEIKIYKNIWQHYNITCC